MERLPSEGGTNPDRLQHVRSKYSKEIRFPIEAGISPENLVLSTDKYLR